MAIETPRTASQRLAFLGDALASWNGGIDFLRFILSAVSCAAPDEQQVVILSSIYYTKTPVALLKRAVKLLAGMPVAPFAEDPKERLSDALRSAKLNFVIVPYRSRSLSSLANAMRRCNARALFPCSCSFGKDFPLPWIGYIADLQHKRMPHFFSEDERAWRDKNFATILEEAPAVVVNSSAVVLDIREFYPRHKAKLFALPFSPPASYTGLPDAGWEQIRRAYGLPSVYFMISNQFWINKSYDTAFLALRMVRNAGHNIHLVCTGNTFDNRWPRYYDDLMTIIEKNGLKEYIHLLGVIPKEDQMAIMRKSLAVIQPTLFEGGPGGGAVYDAVSLNKPCIVSDIPVNREIDIGVVKFFRAGSVEDLAAKMIDMLIHPPGMPATEEMFARLRERQLEFARILANVADAAARGIFA